VKFATQTQPFLPGPVEVAAHVRQLAEAPDAAAFFAALPAALRQLFPGTRVDLLLGGAQAAEPPALTVGDSEAPPARARGVSAHVEWLGLRGFGAVFTLPVRGAGRHLGWLVVGRQDGVDAEILALASNVAALLALRLLFDQAAADLEQRDARARLLERRLRDAEDVRLRATLAAGAAHDVGNLLASVLGHAQLMQAEAPPGMQADLETVERAARDGRHLLRRMLTARAVPASPIEAPESLLPALVHDVIRLTQPFWEARPSVVVRIGLGPVPPVRVHAAELREVLVNLVMNGIAAMPEGGTLTVLTRAEGDRAIVQVSDTGPGLTAEQVEAIFEPLVTTSEAGSGLGLAVSRAIAESYGGTLQVTSDPGRGASFTLSLPAATPEREGG
jgi:signal transduction histidine kinase